MQESSTLYEVTCVAGLCSARYIINTTDRKTAAKIAREQFGEPCICAAGTYLKRYRIVDHAQRDQYGDSLAVYETVNAQDARSRWDSIRSTLSGRATLSVFDGRASTTLAVQS